MSVALLCPTRDRQAQFERMGMSVIATAKMFGEVEIYSCSNGGEDYTGLTFPLDCPTVYMWNKLAAQAMKNPAHKLFMLAADDIIFDTPGWDKALLDHYNALENKIHVYALQDSRDVKGTPHPIVTREYVDAMGYFLPPIFLHWFVDSWTIEIAKANHCFTHLESFQLIHDKPSDIGLPDETHLRIRRNGWHERDAYVNQTCQHFLRIDKERIRHAINKVAA